MATDGNGHVPRQTKRQYLDQLLNDIWPADLDHLLATTPSSCPTSPLAASVQASPSSSSRRRRPPSKHRNRIVAAAAAAAAIVTVTDSPSSTR